MWRKRGRTVPELPSHRHPLASKHIKVPPALRASPACTAASDHFRTISANTTRSCLGRKTSPACDSRRKSGASHFARINPPSE
jgi:hypothetical protein